MKKSVSLSLAIAGVLAVLAVPVLIHAAGPQGNGFCPRGVPPFMAEKYDADHDGKLSAAEEKTAWDAFMKQYDTNRDGKLSREEHQAVREGCRKAFFDSADKNKDGVLSREEFTAGGGNCPRGFGGPGPFGGRGRGPCY